MRVNPNRPFDLVILDLDGTVQDLFKAGQATIPVRNAIAAVQAMGIPVSIGTGRTFDYIYTEAAYLGITTPVVTTQGAVIGDPVTGQVLSATTIPLELARQVAEWLDQTDLVAALYGLDEQGHTQIFQNRYAQDDALRDFHDHVFGGPRTHQASFTALLESAQAPPLLKFLTDNDRATQTDRMPILQELFGVDLYITRTHPRLVEGTAKGVDKGQGLLRLCAMLGVDPQRVLAIGDNDNDIPMLKVAGYGVAMGNGTPTLKAVADWVAPSFKDDGAAVALQRLILDLL